MRSQTYEKPDIGEARQKRKKTEEEPLEEKPDGGKSRWRRSQTEEKPN